MTWVKIKEREGEEGRARAPTEGPVLRSALALGPTRGVALNYAGLGRLVGSEEPKAWGARRARAGGRADLLPRPGRLWVADSVAATASPTRGRVEQSQHVWSTLLAICRTMPKDEADWIGWRTVMASREIKEKIGGRG